MAFEKFQSRTFSAESIKLIGRCNTIISEYQRQGFTLTLRQLYYQLVARAVIPNKVNEYKKLGSLLNNARLTGMVDWSAIEDRTRNVRPPPAWDSPKSILRAVADQYQENPWLRQEWAPEVWIEKDALIGVIEPVCERMRVPFFACRGYTSQSETYAAGKRFQRIQEQEGRKPIVLHLGDHDPSGIDMTRDNAGRLTMFARAGVEVRRLALNMDQIEQYSPPPNPAKESDSRFTDYQEKHGDESWELDALEPTVIDELIDDELATLIDQERWDISMAAEEANKENLVKAHNRWSEVVEFLNLPEEHDDVDPEE